MITKNELQRIVEERRAMDKQKAEEKMDEVIKTYIEPALIKSAEEKRCYTDFCDSKIIKWLGSDILLNRFLRKIEKESSLKVDHFGFTIRISWD